jgi:hypothetical protein
LKSFTLNYRKTQNNAKIANTTLRFLAIPFRDRILKIRSDSTKPVQEKIETATNNIGQAGTSATEGKGIFEEAVRGLADTIPEVEEAMGTAHHAEQLLVNDVPPIMASIAENLTLLEANLGAIQERTEAMLGRIESSRAALDTVAGRNGVISNTLAPLDAYIKVVKG